MDTDANATVKAAGAGIGTVENLPARKCYIEIENKCDTYTFVNPRYYMYHGFCDTPLPPTVVPGATVNALFIKNPNTVTGSVGVFTYDLLKDGKQAAEKIAVMFSVPFDFNLYYIWYALGVVEENTQCDYELYRKLYYDEPSTFGRKIADGVSFTYEGDHITIMGTMSNDWNPVMKVEVRQTGNE